jgi:hypothetical protein
MRKDKTMKWLGLVIVLLAMAPGAAAQDSNPCLDQVDALQAIQDDWNTLRAERPQAVGQGVAYYLELVQLRERVTDIEGCDLAVYMHTLMTLDGDLMFVQIMNGLGIISEIDKGEWRAFIQTEADELEQRYRTSE